MYLLLADQPLHRPRFSNNILICCKALTRWLRQVLPTFKQKPQNYHNFLEAIKEGLLCMIWLPAFHKAWQRKQQAVDRLLLVMVWPLGLIYSAKRQQKKEFQKLAAQAGFEYQLQQLKETGGRIDGTGKDVWAWNIILEAQDNPQYKIDYPGDYAAAVAIVSQSKQIQTEEGVLEVPGFNVDEIFKPTTPTPGVRVEDGVTYTPVPGKTVGGKQVYVDPNGVEGTLP
jgi:hypothetical protein